MYKTKKILCVLIAFVPINCLRIFLYNTLLGYRISYDSRIGMFNLLQCKYCEIDGGTIGHFNRIETEELIMRPKSRIYFMNNIILMNHVAIAEGGGILRKNHVIGFALETDSNLTIGTNSLVTCGHKIDCTSPVSMGSDVVIAGNHSQIWTHGFDVYRNIIRKEVRIGNNVYIGSASLILGGVIICDKVSIGAGSVVSKSIEEQGFWVSSNLYRKK